MQLLKDCNNELITHPEGIVTVCNLKQFAKIPVRATPEATVVGN